MSDTALIVAATAAVIVGLARSLPAIVWAFRCSPKSPHYKHPPAPALLEKIVDALRKR